MTARPNVIDEIIAEKSSTENREAERAVLAALMRNPDAGSIIKLGISADLFTQSAAQEAFRGIADYLADGITPDAATLRAAISSAALIEIETSLREQASAANLSYWVGLLKACRQARLVQAARARLAQAINAGAPAHELQAIIESVRQAEQDDADAKEPRFMWADEFCQNRAELDWLIDKYVPACSVGLLFGDSEAYKSFLLIDMAGHIATGKPWRGQEVQQGNVLFIAGEGGNGLRTRIKAWFEKYDEPMRNFAVSTVPLELCDPKHADLLISDIRQFIGNESFSFIVLDTLNTHFGAGDENATSDMTRFRLAALKLSQATGATVAISHHCGHQDKTRSRGNISLHNGIDWEFKLERSGDYTTLTGTKMKDAPTPPPLSWTLAQQPLQWADKHGNPINGAVLEPAETQVRESQSTQRGKPMTGKASIALDALRTALMQHGVEERGIVTVAKDQWRQAAYKAGISASDSTQDAKRKAFNRARDGLVAYKHVACDDGKYWIPYNRTEPDRTGHCPAVSGLGMGTDRPDRTGHTPIRGVRLSGCPAAPDTAQETKPREKTDGAIAAQWRNSEDSHQQQPPTGDADRNNERVY